MNAKPASRQDGLLLYSMISFRGIIEPVLALAKPRSICEIGVEKGLFTEFLLHFCSLNRCRYSGIDPSLDLSFMAERTRDEIVFFRERSLPVMEKLESHDVYFIDGDHNYFTVKNELRLIFRHRDHWPLIFLHDLCWPWGRRDQYCAPELIPAEHRHPFSTELAVVPGDSSLHGSGFCGKESDYQYAAALHEGGPCNGVLTAVEDVIAEKGPDNLRLLVVPAVFGLGLLYSPAHLNPELWLFIERVASGVNLFHSLFDSLEHNRIDLFLTYLQQVKQLQTIHQRYSELDGSFSDLLSNYRQAEGESGRLLLDYNSLQSAYDELTAEFNALQRKYAELHQTYRDLEGAYDGLEEHNKTLQSSYDELLRYTKWLETNATVNKAK